MFLTEYSA